MATSEDFLAVLLYSWKRRSFTGIALLLSPRVWMGSLCVPIVHPLTEYSPPKSDFLYLTPDFDSMVSLLLYSLDIPFSPWPAAPVACVCKTITRQNSDKE